MEEVQKRSLDVAVKNSRPLGSHRRKELGKVSIQETDYWCPGGGTCPCSNPDKTITASARTDVRNLIGRFVFHILKRIQK